MVHRDVSYHRFIRIEGKQQGVKITDLSARSQLYSSLQAAVTSGLVVGRGQVAPGKSGSKCWSGRRREPFLELFFSGFLASSR